MDQITTHNPDLLNLQSVLPPLGVQELDGVHIGGASGMDQQEIDSINNSDGPVDIVCQDGKCVNEGDKKGNGATRVMAAATALFSFVLATEF